MTQSFAQDEVVGGCHQDLDVLLGHFSICLELGRWVDAVRCSRFPFNGMKRDREIGEKVEVLTLLPLGSLFKQNLSQDTNILYTYLNIL